MDIPAIYLPAGPMLRGNWKGKVLGSGSDAWKYWDERRAGKISDDDWVDVEAGIARSYGTCMTMGTAATMMAMAETLGMSLPGASSIPAADANHIRMASESGRRIVEMVWEDLTPKKILSREAFLNAIGYGWMFTRHIKQANEGCDFDFLETGFGAPVPEPSIY